MASKKWPFKDPDEVLDYSINWAGEDNDGPAADDVIVTSTWDVPDGLTQDSEENTDTTTTIWLSGGTAGETYEVVNEIVTTGGRTWNQTVRLPIKVR